MIATHYLCRLISQNARGSSSPVVPKIKLHSRRPCRGGNGRRVLTSTDPRRSSRSLVSPGQCVGVVSETVLVVFSPGRITHLSSEVCIGQMSPADTRCNEYEYVQYPGFCTSRPGVHRRGRRSGGERCGGFGPHPSWLGCKTRQLPPVEAK